MNLRELQSAINQLVNSGHGDKEVIVTEGAAQRSWGLLGATATSIFSGEDGESAFNHFSGPLCNSRVGDVFVELHLDDD